MLNISAPVIWEGPSRPAHCAMTAGRAETSQAACICKLSSLGPCNNGSAWGAWEVAHLGPLDNNLCDFSRVEHRFSKGHQRG